MRVSGLASNVDWEQLVDQLMQIESRPVQALMQQKVAIQRQEGLWLQARTLLTSVGNAARNLKDKELFNQFAVTSSHSDKVSASVSGTVIPGTYEITVEQLAQAHTIASAQGVDLSEPVGASGKLILGGGEQTIEIDVSGDDTAQTIAKAINEAMEKKSAEDNEFIPVWARVIGNRLVLTRGATGEGEISISDDQGGALLNALGLAGSGDNARETIRAGQNAIIRIDGLEIQSETNTVSAVPGLSIVLHEADASTTIKLSVSHDRKFVEGRVNALVTAYNNVAKQLADWTGQGQPLQGDYLARSISDSLRRRLSSTYGEGGQAMTLMELGIQTSGSDGTISFDAETFWKAYEANPEAVEAALSAVAADLESYIDSLVGRDGLLKSREDTFKSRVRTLDSSIERMQQRLEMRRQSMINRFVQLEQLMARMLTQSDWLAAQTQYLNLNWRGAGGNRR